jgi:DNA-binding NarL/FixJ family response regulator
MKTRSSPIRVAMVEDHQPFRESLLTVLKGSPGFRCVASCADAEEALREIPASKPEVVLMDLQLPKLSGIECMRRLKRQHPTIKFLALSNFDDSETIFGAIVAGATGYIVKCVPYAQILDAIEEVNQGGAPMTPHVARLVLNLVHSQSSVPDECEPLTNREKEVLRLARTGLRYHEIAKELHISYDTVRTHFNHIYQKLHVHSRAEAVMKLGRAGAEAR